MAYAADGCIDPFYITVVGEFKDRRSVIKEEFTGEEMGQMHSFLEELLHYQPHRHEVTG